MINCANCQTPIVRRNATKFCSLQCQANLRWKTNVLLFEKTGKLENPLQRKRYMIEKFGHQCSICKLTEWQDKPIPLVMDHINGNPEDNSITNFRFVCGNCDMQLPTYKSKNKGNGRAYRRQRYKEGKTY